MENIEKVQGMLPLLPLRGLTAFPNTTVYIDVGRERSLAALESAMDSDRRLLLVSQRNVNCDQPEQADLFSVGTVARVRHVMPVSDEIVRLACEGEARALLLAVDEKQHYAAAMYVKMETDMSGDPIELTGYAERAKTLFSALSRERGRVSGELVQIVESETNPDTLADIIAANALRKVDDKQKLLECRSVLMRLQLLCGMLREEIELSRIEHEIEEKVKERIEEHQRDYYLHEQLKVVQEELGDDDEREIAAMRDKLAKSKMNEEAREKTRREIDRLSGMARGTPEAAVCENYIDWMLNMPWGVETGGKIDMVRARKVLEADHYGLEKVKERILEYLAVCSVRGDMKSPILCLVGPPGVGKTSIASSVARALKRKFVRVALGGLHDEAEIRGHRRTYIGSQPGRIAASLRQCGVMDPVFLFDEIDKMASDFRGDPASAMLEALDPAQNSTFTDHYLDAPFDLSRVLFITTANSAEDIPEPLLDRMELIEVPSYTLEEKVQIARRHLLPRQVKEHGLSRSQLKVTDKAFAALIEGYTREAGVRTLEREIGHVCRKAVLEMIDRGEDRASFKTTVKPEMLEHYLGIRRFLPDEVGKEPETGVVNGLAWTQVGGTTMPIEVAVMPGQGAIEMTGRLGDVMKESARTALSYIRSRSHELGLDEEFHKKNDIHIHVPEGAVPKDGPSAGVALTCAMVSALTGIPARQDAAMTGEITLRGHVLPIGGVKEKLLAAYRLGITTLLLPSGNEKDLTELPKDVRERLDIHLLKQVDEALNLLLVRQR
ncbi:MAG: endopeptidase La [Clostridia bacterium]|nr:endopeptidase La [Clostridia bacterium]